MEEWRAVPGFEGLYEVSSEGRVRSWTRVSRGAFLRPGRASNGYDTVTLGGESRTVHSLVLTAFRGPAEGRIGRHLDGNRSRSVLSNLEWGTYAENQADARAHGTRVLGEKYPTAKLTDGAAREIRRLKGAVSQSALAARYGVSPAAVQAVHDGRTWKHV